MEIGLSLSLTSNKGGGDVGRLVAALKAYGPAFLLVADAGAQDVSGNGRHPFPSATLAAPTIVPNTFRNRAAMVFDGTKAYRVPPFAAKWWVAVAEHGVTIWPDYWGLYLSGSNGSFANYVFSANFGSGVGDAWGNATGTRKINEVIVPGVTSNLEWNARHQLDSINIYEMEMATTTQTVDDHHLGQSVGNATRTYQGKLYALMALSVAPSSGDKAAIYSLLRNYFQKKLIACQGDSLTFGIGSTGTLEPNSYPRQLRALLGSQNWNLWSLGVSGASLNQMITGAPVGIDSQNPDVLVFWGGTNDVGFLNGPAVTAAPKIVTYCAARRAAIPNAKILVCTLRPSTTAGPSNPTNYNVQAPLLNAAILADARYTDGTLAHGVVRIDQIPELADPTDTTYTTDGMHLTNAGYGLVAAKVHAALVAYGYV